MVFPRPRLKLAAAVFAVGVFICSAPAQSSDQPLIFSKPADDGMGNANSTTPALPNAPAGVSGGSSFFNFSGDAPMTAPAFNNNARQSAQNKNQNWMLMTPEEIMGLPTPEQIMGLPDPDKNLSPEEKFLKRQANSSAQSATNAPGQTDTSLWGNNHSDAFDRSKAGDLFSQPDGRAKSTDFDAVKAFSQLSALSQSSSPFSQLKKMSASDDNLFGVPAAPKTDPNQVAAMDRFRALLGTPPPPENPVATALPSASPKPDTDPLQSQFGAAGHSLTSVSSFNKPDGLAALSQLPGSTPPPAETKRPAWQAQIPPWLSDAPPTTPPVRSF